MARPLRIEYDGAFYRVMTRATRGRIEQGSDAYIGFAQADKEVW